MHEAGRLPGAVPEISAPYTAGSAAISAPDTAGIAAISAPDTAPGSAAITAGSAAISAPDTAGSAAIAAPGSAAISAPDTAGSASPTDQKHAEISRMTAKDVVLSQDLRDEEWKKPSDSDPGRKPLLPPRFPPALCFLDPCFLVRHSCAGVGRRGSRSRCGAMYRCIEQVSSGTEQLAGAE